MTKAGLADPVILKKISETEGRYDISVAALVELKNAGVTDIVIDALLEKRPEQKNNTIFPIGASAVSDSPVPAPDEILSSARTIAFKKSSVQPSIRALQKELLKQRSWSGLGLTIDQYWGSADLYVEIGYVHMSWITHRYTYTIYDRRSGTVLAAGETTSWGSLAENLAGHIVRSLSKLKAH